MNYGKSICKGPWLHRFFIRRQSTTEVEEVCAICHARKFFKVRDGRPNNYEYLAYHLRSALQFHHKRFLKEYAKQTV